MAARSSVRMSAGVAAVATFRPGTWVNHASSDWECWAAAFSQPPVPARITIGTRGLAPEHVAGLRRLVDHLVHGAGDEVHVHDLGDRPEPGHGGADREAHDRALRDRRVPDPGRAELVPQSLGRAVGTAVPDVLAQAEDGGVLGHRLPQRERDRLRVAEAGSPSLLDAVGEHVLQGRQRLGHRRRPRRTRPRPRPWPAPRRGSRRARRRRARPGRTAAARRAPADPAPSTPPPRPGSGTAAGRPRSGRASGRSRIRAASARARRERGPRPRWPPAWTASTSLPSTVSPGIP